MFLVISSLLIACGDDDNITPDFSANVAISTSTNSINENGGNLTVSITMDQVNNTGAALSIPIQIDGSATNGDDYQAIQPNISIASGSNAAEINIITINDQLEEGDEQITLSINSSQLPTGISAGSQTSISITIMDDDGGNSTPCDNDNSIDQDNHECDETPSVSNTYSENIASGERTITTNAE